MREEENQMTTTLTGAEARRLMRRRRHTIRSLALQMAVTQKRIREVREKGLTDPNSIRDWVEAITGQDPGPIPERYCIRHRDEEAECCYCGYPLFVGDYAYEYGLAVYCSKGCCHQHRRYESEPAA
jgi:hypothetical protein